MQAIDVLTREHALIERVLDRLETAVQRIHRGEPAPLEFLAWTVRFLRQFADGRHHHKEEVCLFPLLEQRGMPRAQGPIGVMLTEHELGRELLRRMSVALTSGRGTPQQFADAAAEYVILLRQHIFKENRILFPMAEQLLQSPDDASLLARYGEQEGATEAEAEAEQWNAELDQWSALLDRGQRPAPATTEPV